MTEEARPTRVKAPFVMQMEAVECGAACLTMTLRAFGHFAELSEVRDACGVSRDGVSAKQIVRTARTYGLVVKARRLEPAELGEVATPAILHWEMNHFVLLDRWTPTEVHILDPAIGPRRVSSADFDRSFTGICIELRPGEGFQRKSRSRASIARYARPLRSAGGALGVLVGTSFLLNVLGLAVPLATQSIVDNVLVDDHARWLGPIAAAAAGLVALLFTTSLLRGWLLVKLRSFLDAGMTRELAGHLFSLPVRFFTQRQTADLVARVDSIRVVREILAERAIALFVDVPLSLTYAFLLQRYDLRVALVVVATALVQVAVFFAARGPQLARYRERLVKEVRASVALLQIVRGAATLKASGRELHTHQKWLRLFVHALNASVDEARVRILAEAALLAARVIGPAITLCWGAALVIEGQLSLGELLGLSMIVAALLAPLESALGTLLAVQQLPLYLARIDDVLDTAPEASGAAPCPPLTGEVRFENVTFRYGPTAPPTLEGLSFSVKAGEKIALVGPSGSGKSTVARLLLGLYAPESGRILVDGHDLATLDLDSVRRQMGAVLQETALFDGTVRENLTLYHPSATLDQVVTAARAAQIHREIDSLPLGYDTPLGASGGPFSGGQRQRLALARAVLHRPRVMILDEATSALDTVTEGAVDQYLSSRACTRIVIAHRLATVRDADRIIVLVDGRVAEEGRHEELLAKGGAYADLVAHAEVRPEVGADTSVSSSAIAADDFSAVNGLAELSREDRARLATLAVRRQVSEGVVLIGQGDRAPGLFVVVSGELDVMLDEPGLERRRVGSVGARALLGEVSFLDGSAASASIVVSKRTEVLHLPARDLERLRSDGDTLAGRLTLTLGRLLAKRLRDKTTEREKLSGLPSTSRPAPDDEVAAAPDGDASGAPRALMLSQTALGASLTEPDLARFAALGATRTLKPGEVLFAQGDDATASYLVLGGRVGVFLAGIPRPINVLRAGEILGEVGLFDPGPRTASCVATERATVFSIDHAALRARLDEGDAMAAKVLRHLNYSLVKAFRVSDLRLREAIAVRDGEEASARVAREQARILDESRDLVMTATLPSGQVPVVPSDPGLSGAACLCALLRMDGRPSPFTAVAEACADAGRVTASSLVRGARAFGLEVRTMTLDADDLRWIVSPLILEEADGLFSVAEGWQGDALVVMTPTEGRALWSKETLAKRFRGTVHEARRPEVEVGAPLAARIRLVLGRRGVAIGIIASAVALQLVALLPGLALSVLVGIAIPRGDLSLVEVVAVTLVGFGLVTAMLHAMRAYGLSFLRTMLDRTLLDQLVRHVIGLRIDFFERHSAGSVLARFEAFRVVREVVGNQGLAALLDAPLLALTLVAVAVVDLGTGAVGALALVLELLLLGVLVPRFRVLARRDEEEGAVTRSRLIEVLTGIVTLRAVGASSVPLRRFLPEAHKSLATSASQSLLGNAWSSSADLVRLGAVVLSSWWGAVRVLDGELALSALLTATALLGTMLLVAREIGNHAIAFSVAVSRIRLLDRTFAEPPEQRADLRVHPGKLRGRLALDGVSFAYDDENGEPGADVLSDISLSIDPGTKVALVGGSGSGKSTLGKLLLGFYVPRRGRVLFDGRDLASLDLQAVRSQVGVVLQDAQLFAGSVRDNIAVGAPDANIDDVVEAAKKADIHEVIVPMPMGYETLLAEGGAGFSGGQRQRLAVARALVHQPSVLLLDEATSALDNASQGRIERALSSLSCTRIVIAHRMSTVMDADQIVVLERGKIVEVGRHEELVAKKGRYHALVQAETGSGAASDAQRPW